MRIWFSATAVAAALLGSLPATVGASNAEAKARLVLTDGTRVGAVWFDDENGGTVVTARIDALPGFDGVSPEGFHGVHVHRNDQGDTNDCVLTASTDRTTWFTQTDGHYNPGSVAHGAHAGDLPVILLDADGDGWVKSFTPNFDVDDVVGRAVIVHEKADNYNNIPSSGANGYTPNSAGALTTTANTGNAGNRIACGVIVAD